MDVGLIFVNIIPSAKTDKDLSQFDNEGSMIWRVVSPSFKVLCLLFNVFKHKVAAF